MPHSPFTRYYGLAIVAAYALALLWPDERAYIWGMYALIALPLVIGVFTWSAVGGAPPFDDNAFHRTLPPGDDHAFRKVIMIHVMVLAGVALSVVAYCWIFNFGWRVMSYGIALLTLPVWGWMAACGIATSLATTRQQGKTWGYLAIFAIPAFSWTWLYWLRLGFEWDNRQYVYFNSLRTMALTAAVLYPLIWWLVAAKRRRILGFVFGMATSALMPWLYIYGDFVEAPERDREEQAGESHVTITRKPTLPTDGKWLPIDELLTIDGLRGGEFLSLHLYVERPPPERWEFFNIWAIPEQATEAYFEPKRARITAVRSLNGNIAWGEQAVWNHLLEQVPAHGTFSHWNQDLDAPTRLALLRPGASWVRGPRKSGANFSYQQKLKDEDLAADLWRSSFGDVFRLKRVGDFAAASGGSCRLPESGIIRVKPLAQEGSRFSITLRRFYPQLGQAHRPWFEPRQTSGGWDQDPWVIAVDESSQHAFALAPLRRSNSTGRERVMLGGWDDWIFEAGEAKTREQVARMEMLRHCRLHVFWPEWVAPLQREILPPR